MRWESVKRLFQVPGPLMSLTLIGILLLSAVLYYRAVKIQRFLEPALAISTPRFLFSKNVSALLAREFGAEHGNRIRYATNSILIERSLISSPGRPGSDAAVLQKLSDVFLSALQDPNMADYVDFVLVGVRFTPSEDARINEVRRVETQRRAELVLRSLFQASPELARKYGVHFSATALSGNPSGKDTEWIEFRFIPSEMLHIEVLKSLKKYVR